MTRSGRALAFKFISNLSKFDSTSASTRIALGYPLRSSSNLHLRSAVSSRNNNKHQPNRCHSHSNSTSSWVAKHPLAPTPDSGTDMSLDPRGIDPDVFETESEEYDFDRIDNSSDTPSHTPTPTQQSQDHLIPISTSTPPSTSPSIERREKSNSIIQQPLPSASHLLSKTILSNTPPSNSIPVATSLLKDFLQLNTFFVGEESKVVYLLASLRSLRLKRFQDSLLWLSISPSSWRKDLESLDFHQDLIQAIRNGKEEVTSNSTRSYSDSGKSSLNHKDFFNFILLHSINSTSISTDLKFLQELVLLGIRKDYFDFKLFSKRGKEKEEEGTMESNSNFYLLEKLIARIFRYGGEEEGKEMISRNENQGMQFWRELVNQSRISKEEKNQYLKTELQSSINNTNDLDLLELKFLPDLFNLIIRTLILSGKMKEALEFINISPSLILNQNVISERDEFGFELHIFTYKLMIEEFIKTETKMKVNEMEDSDLKFKASDIEKGLRARLALNHDESKSKSEDQIIRIPNENDEIRKNIIKVKTFVSSFNIIPYFLRIEEIEKRLFGSNHPNFTSSTSSSNSPLTASDSTSILQNKNLTSRIFDQSSLDSKLIKLLEGKRFAKIRKVILKDLRSNHHQQRHHSHGYRNGNFDHLPSIKTLSTFFKLIDNNQPPECFKNFIKPIKISLSKTFGGKSLFENSILFCKVNGYLNDVHHLGHFISSKNQVSDEITNGKSNLNFRNGNGSSIQNKNSEISFPINHKRYLDSISYYHSKFLMGEKNGPFGIDEELFQSIGISIERLKFFNQRWKIESQVNSSTSTLTSTSTSDSTSTPISTSSPSDSESSDPIANALIEVDEEPKIWPSSHTIPLILKCLIRLTLIDSRKIQWFKQKVFKRKRKLNDFDFKLNNLDNLYRTWISKAFLQIEENDEKFIIKKNQYYDNNSIADKGDSNQQWNQILDIPKINETKFSSNIDSVKVTNHCFDQFIVGYLKIFDEKEKEIEISKRKNSARLRIKEAKRLALTSDSSTSEINDNTTIQISKTSSKESSNQESSNSSTSTSTSTSDSSSSSPTIKFSPSLSKTLSILQDMKNLSIEPKISTWNLILSSVAKEGRHLIFSDINEEERLNLRKGFGNGLGWKRTFELAQLLGIGTEEERVMKDALNQEKKIERKDEGIENDSSSSTTTTDSSDSGLPKANLFTYINLIESLSKVSINKGGPMLIEANIIKDLMFKFAEKNSSKLKMKANLKESEEEIEEESFGNDSGSHSSSSFRIDFTMKELEDNQLVKKVLKRLENLEQKSRRKREENEG